MARKRLPRYLRAQYGHAPETYRFRNLTIGEAVASLVENANGLLLCATADPQATAQEQSSRITTLVDEYFASIPAGQPRTARIIARGMARTPWMVLGSKRVRLRDMVCALPVIITDTEIRSPRFGVVWSA